MNNFSPKYLKMASQYLQERLDSVKSIEKIQEIHLLPIERKNSHLKNLLNWIFKN